MTASWDASIVLTDIVTMQPVYTHQWRNLVVGAVLHPYDQLRWTIAASLTSSYSTHTNARRPYSDLILVWDQTGVSLLRFSTNEIRSFAEFFADSKPEVHVPRAHSRNAAALQDEVERCTTGAFARGTDLVYIGTTHGRVGIVNIETWEVLLSKNQMCARHIFSSLSFFFVVRTNMAAMPPVHPAV